MPIQEDYQVTLETFYGPMDLLLHLIRQAEVDITRIRIVEITDQYLSFLRQLDDVDVDQAGEFLVMAATLVEIKSRTLARERASEDDSEGDAVAELEPSDPGYELIQQLLAYQRYRLAAEALEERRTAFAMRFARRPGRRDVRPEIVEPVELELDDVHVLDLSETYERIAGSIDFSRLGDHVVEMDDTPIELHEEDLLDQLERSVERRLSLQDAFIGASRAKRIGLFLATLELVRLRRITVVQDDIDSAIELVLNADPDQVDDEGGGDDQSARPAP